MVPSSPPPPAQPPGAPPGSSTRALDPGVVFGPFAPFVSLTAAGADLTFELASAPSPSPSSAESVSPASTGSPVSDADLLLWGHPIGTLQTFSATPAALAAPDTLSALFGRLSVRGPVELVVHLPPGSGNPSVTVHPATADPVPTGKPTALSLVADLGAVHVRVAISGVTAPRLTEPSPPAAPAALTALTAPTALAASDATIALDGGEYFFELRLATTAAAASIARAVNRPAHFRARRAAIEAVETAQSPRH